MDASPSQPLLRSRRLLPLGLCAGLLLVFAVTSWTAVLTKSATADEPLHAMGGYVRLFYGDFRVNPEDPPLWSYWAMIPHSRDTLKLDRTVPEWEQMIGYMWRQWAWVTPTLYRTPGNDPEAFVNRSRAMMLIVGLALGATLIAWAWKLAGPAAAVAVAVLYAFDPSFLGHAPLVKNDVAITAVTLATMFVVWSVGRRARWWNVALLGLLVGTALNTKFSGLILVPIVVLSVAVRAVLRTPWSVLGRRLERLWPKSLAAAAIVFSCALACVAITWASFGFRYAPTPDPHVRLNLPLILKAAARTELLARDPGRVPTDAQMRAHPPSAFSRAVLFADRHALMPHAWLAGLLDTYATTRIRAAYLLGEIRLTGWWYYFPLAMLFKTPVATLVAAAVAITVAVASARGVPGHSPPGGPVAATAPDRWSLACVLIPVLVYGASALSTNLNLGLRHVFPIYPFAFLLVSVVVARLWRQRRRATLTVGMVLAIALAAESLASWPHYIAFFNTPSGGARGGLRLLGDSNLDWGQDLKLLAKWQRANPGTRLYVAYFGMADPDYYLEYTALPGNSAPFPPPQLPAEPGVAAISATHLQGIYLGPSERALYGELMRRQEPIEVLGGTIYLFRVND